MNILRIAYEWPPPWAGLVPHIYELTKAQVKLGHKVSVFCGRWPKSGEIERPTNVKIHSIWREPLKGTLHFTGSVILFFKYLNWRRHNEADIVHCHGHFGIWIYVYRFFLKKLLPWSKELKTPLVAHFHNTAKGRWEKLKEQGKSISAISKNVAWPMEVFANKLAVKIASACIFVSEDTLKEATKYYRVDPKKCFVVESGVNTDIFTSVGDEEKEKSRKELGLDIYDKVVLNHGMLVGRKNIHLLVEAMAHLPKQYKLLLSGPCEGAYLERLNKLIKDNDLSERVLLTGYIPYPYAPIVYQVSDVFVLPSDWEGLPKVVVEGLASGIPCLVSGFKLSEDIKGLHYIKDLDSRSIAESIQRVVESDEGVDANKVVLNYSWADRAKKVDSIYEFAKKNYI